MNTKASKGFTLIELMIVIAILAILLALAIPAYQNYSIRASNSECVNLIASIKLAVVDAAHSNGTMISSVQLADTGIDPSMTNTPKCSDFNIVDGVISISSIPGDGASAGDFTFSPNQADVNSTVGWDCASTHANPQHVPAICR